MLAGRRQVRAVFQTGEPAEPIRDEMGEALRDEFEYLWKNSDPWNLETSEYEQKKYLRQFELIDDRRYESALEIGSGNGCFSRLLSPIAGKVLALDISESAIARARTVCTGFDNVEFGVANIVDFDLANAGPFDLLVMSETIYYLAAAYGAADVGSQVRRLLDATKEGGRMLMANSLDTEERRTGKLNSALAYREIVVQAGFQLDHEETFWHQPAGGERIGALVSVFHKPSGQGA